MDEPRETFEQIEEFASHGGDAKISDLRRLLKILQKDTPPVDDSLLRERWQNAHDRISLTLNQKLVQRRFAVSMSFGGGTLLLIAYDLFFR